MSDLAIRVENLGKLYQIGKRERYRTLRDSITDTLTTPFRRLRNFQSANGNGTSSHIWALKDVSFEVKRGEVIGVIGRNGAGKSTLLKVLSRITEPTEGHAEIHGRVGSLLEVGTGFHPELTGRENIYLNGAILGMKRAEINRKFDEIVAFAEVEKFLDTPVKHYSSGMYVRLAFAVAAHLEPEILVVDEVLAVGDAAFQKKCLGKIGEVANEGRTILFVSHSMPAVRSLCHEALHMQHGQIVKSGPVTQIVMAYLADSQLHRIERIWSNAETAPGTEAARVHAVRVVQVDGSTVNYADITQPLVIEVDYWVLQSATSISVSLSLFTADETYVLASPSVSGLTPNPPIENPGLYRSRCCIPGNFLNEGRYAVTVLLVQRLKHVLAQVDRAVSFETRDLGQVPSQYFGYWGGVVRPQLAWESTCIGSVPSGKPELAICSDRCH